MALEDIFRRDSYEDYAEYTATWNVPADYLGLIIRHQSVHIMSELAKTGMIDLECEYQNACQKGILGVKVCLDTIIACRCLSMITLNNPYEYQYLLTRGRVPEFPDEFKLEIAYLLTTCGSPVTLTTGTDSISSLHCLHLRPFFIGSIMTRKRCLEVALYDNFNPYSLERMWPGVDLTTWILARPELYPWIERMLVSGNYPASISKDELITTVALNGNQEVFNMLIKHGITLSPGISRMMQKLIK